MEKNILHEYLHAAERVRPVMVDEALFEVILAKSKLQRDAKTSFVNPRFLKCVAVVIVLLVTINCWSLIKLSHSNQQDQPLSASAQLVSEYTINR